MIPVLDEALREASITWDGIDAIAVTKGPGLVGSLIVGVNTARTLALLHQKPLIAVHHTEGHVYANWLHKDVKGTPSFPLVCLTVSGGHTNLLYMEDHLAYQIIGETHDDAAGEAYDKVAKLLGLGYPGGPLISLLSQKGDKHKYKFPLVDLTTSPVRGEDGFMVTPEESLDFSYSGLKSAVIRKVRELESQGKELSEREKADIAASFQYTANEILARNLERAVKRYNPASILLSGGVAANVSLREQIIDRIGKSTNFYYPELKCCTDNAAMIAAAAYFHAQKGELTTPSDLTPDPNYKLT